MSIEAMKLALEALEIEQQALAYEHGKVEHIENAITALRQAIEQAQKQEPVAWGFQNSAITGSNRWMMLREEIPANDQYDGALWTPLYTSPPQRQPLTDEQISDLVQSTTGITMPFYKAFVRAIEAAHGIKGEA